MKTSFKKLTSVFLAVLMLVSVFSVVGVAAAETGKTQTGSYTVVLDASNAGVDAVEWKAWTWAEGENGHWAEAHGTSNADITFDALEENIIFAYFQWGTGTPNEQWGGKIAQSGNMKVEGSTFTVTNANGTVEGTWSGSAGGGGDDPYNPGGGDDPYNPGGGGSGTYTVVLDASNAGVDAVEWKAWTWAEGENGHWAEAHGTSNADITFDALEENIIFAYFHWGTGTPDDQWGGKIAQSGNMKVEGSTFTVTNANGTVEGTWSGSPSGGGGDDPYNPDNPDNPDVGTITASLNPGSASGAGDWYAWTWNEGGAEGSWVTGSQSGDVITFNGLCGNVIFASFSGYPDKDWTGRIGQTETLAVAENATFVIDGEIEGDDGYGNVVTKYTGDWSYDPIQPVTDDPQPVTDDPQPVTDDPQPVTDDPQPVTDDPTPTTTDAPVTIPTDTPVPTTTNAPVPGQTGVTVNTQLNGTTVNTSTADKSITVVYNLSAPMLLEDGQGTLYYDSTKLKLTSFTLPNVDSVAPATINTNLTNEAKFNFTAVDSATQSGKWDFKTAKVFVEAKFDVVGTGSTVVNLDIEELDGYENGQEVAYYTNKVASAAAASITQTLSNPTVTPVNSEAETTAPVQPTTGVTPVTPTTSPVTPTVAPTTAPTEPTTSVTPVTPSSNIKLSATSKSLKAGKTYRLKAIGTSAKPKFTNSNKKVIKVTSKGKITALKKGTATVTVKVAGKTLKCTVKVTSTPKAKINGKKFKASKTYKITKGKKLTVKITGKAAALKNKYSSTKASVAKVKAKIKASTIKIKGLKKGTATIKIKVNRVKTFKIKVKVV